MLCETKARKRDVFAFQNLLNDDFFNKLNNCLKKAHKQVTGWQRLRIYGDNTPPPAHWKNCRTLSELTGIDKAEILQAIRLSTKDYLPRLMEKPSAYQIRLLKMGVNMHALTWLRTIAGDKQGIAYIEVGHNNITFENVKKREITAGQIIILDATGDASFYSGLMGRDFKEHRIDAELPGYNRVLIQKKLGKGKGLKASDDELKRLLNKADYDIRKCDKVLLVTFLGIEKKLLEIAKTMWPDKTVESTHFYASRGLNNWQNFDAVILFGTPNPNTLAAFNGTSLAYTEQKDIESYINRIAERELTQNEHRVRPIFGNKTAVFIGNFCPGLADRIEPADKGNSEGARLLKYAKLSMRNTDF